MTGRYVAFLRLFLFLPAISWIQLAFGQYLSNLHATASDPVYTTYAAAFGRSEYTLNQGYHFCYYDHTKPLVFESKQGGNIALALRIGKTTKLGIGEYHTQPVITVSYPDMVKFTFQPFRDILVNAIFVVHSSRAAIWEMRITNASLQRIDLEVFPFFHQLGKHINIISSTADRKGFYFQHRETPDSWTLQHKIPFVPEIINLWFSDRPATSCNVSDGIVPWNVYSTIPLFDDSGYSQAFDKTKTTGQAIAWKYNLILNQGETKSIRWIRVIEYPSNPETGMLETAIRLMQANLVDYQIENENLFRIIPWLDFSDNRHEALYWNAFSLIRQCMLPPEGQCSYNYYVFSREPRWGWGYGGQVFHESLVMLAYAYMDPQGAMNSQRIYMERQHPDGYINYRTGPYLNETIETNGVRTTSAPWYNWINLEVFNVTRDTSFLFEAFNSGRRFYEFVVANRDSDGDGLCEWGGHAVLESVRDARVAIWDQVAPPETLEALDLNLMLVMEARALSQMAQVLKFENERKQFTQDAEKRKNLINKYMWDNSTGFYYHVDKKNHSFTYKIKDDLKRREIIAFLALWAGVADKQQAKRLVTHLKNPSSFWRKYGIPTLAADDLYYNPMGYWNGPVWVQWQYLIFRGLLDYGYQPVALELAGKVMNQMAYQLSTNHWFWEFYSPDDLQCGWNKTYIWAGIIARFMIDMQVNNVRP